VEIEGEGACPPERQAADLTGSRRFWKGNAMLDASILAALGAFDTPTVCNALERIDGRWRDRGYTRGPLHSYGVGKRPMVGYAATATIRSYASPAGAADGKARKLAYYQYISECVGPTIVVMQDIDGDQRGSGPFWGEFSASVHRSFGCVGVVTDGSVRDLMSLPDGFPILSGAGPRPSHAHVHAVDFGVEVNVSGMQVSPGDLVHADENGAVAFDPVLAAAVLDEAAECVASEHAILEACRRGRLGFDEFARLYLRK
jgi:regulator of RNase E activity RraA